MIVGVLNALYNVCRTNVQTSHLMISDSSLWLQLTMTTLFSFLFVPDSCGFSKIKFTSGGTLPPEIIEIAQKSVYDHNVPQHLSKVEIGFNLFGQWTSEQQTLVTITVFILYTLLTSQCDQKRKRIHHLILNVHCSKKTLIWRNFSLALHHLTSFDFLYLYIFWNN